MDAAILPSGITGESDSLAQAVMSNGRCPVTNERFHSVIRLARNHAVNDIIWALSHPEVMVCVRPNTDKATQTCAEDMAKLGAIKEFATQTCAEDMAKLGGMTESANAVSQDVATHLTRLESGTPTESANANAAVQAPAPAADEGEAARPAAAKRPRRRA